MLRRVITAVLVVAVCVGGCTTEGSTPATAPNTTAPVTSTTTGSTSTSSTTTLPPTSTTVDRLTEVTAIFEDLERRRLEAIYSGDVEAFTALFADTPYLDQSLQVFELVEPGPAPPVSVEVLEVLRDDPSCLATLAVASVGNPARQGERATTVLVPKDGAWVYAFAYPGREGWLCDGPHPLGS